MPELPDHLKKHAPKREDYPSEEDYLEARAFFLHRTKAAVQHHSRGSHEK